MAQCSICAPEARERVEEAYAQLGNRWREIGRVTGLASERIRNHYREEHFLRPADYSKETVFTKSSGRKERITAKDGVSIKWDKNGDGVVLVLGNVRPPSKDEIRATLKHMGEDPDDYNIVPSEFSWNSAAWQRDQEVALANAEPRKKGDPIPTETAYTAPSLIVRYRIIKKTGKDMVPVIMQATPLNVVIRSTNRLPKRSSTEQKCALIFGDAQIGYFEDRDGRYLPFHDESALDCSLQVAADVETTNGIDVMADVGDLGDLPMFSPHPSAVRATQHGSLNMTIDRAHLELARRSAISPNAIKKLMKGNHEERLNAWIAKFAPQLVGLKRAGDTNYDLPVLSWASLLRIAEIGWESSGRSYPNDVFWLNENTRVIHGEVANAKPGITLAKLLTEEVNTIQGHTPHGGTAYRTVARGGSTRTYVAHIVPGFMRTDNMVPASSSKGDDWGVPSESDGKPWEQGFSVIYFDELGKTVPQIEYIPIFGGRCTWRGKIYEARCDVNGDELFEGVR